MNLEIVVAYYHEDLNWTRDLPCIIYDKSGTDHGYINLPNIGREAQTYLYHIITRYDRLADRTAFVQGNPFDHCMTFKDQIKENFQGWRPYSHHGNLCFNDNEKNVPEYYTRLFGVPPPEHYEFVGGAMFGVTKDLILAKPLSFWQKALKLMDDYENAPFLLERMWKLYFTTPTHYSQGESSLPIAV